jgi:hypothetical protein
MAKRDPSMRNIERRSHERTDGSELFTYRIRWMDEDGQRQRETFDTVDGAIRFRDELEARAMRLRDGPADRAHVTVADAKERWWNEHVLPTLAQRTRDNYAGVWRRHVQHRLEGLLLIDLTTPEIERVKDEMLGDGVGAPTVRTAIALLGSVLGYATRRGTVELQRGIGRGKAVRAS